MRRELQRLSHLGIHDTVLDFSSNHFDLFGLPAVFALDSDQLAGRYRDLQRELHPDRFAAAGEREKRLSLQASTLVNEAYQTLKDPLSRARYLLTLRAGAAGDDKETTQDMAFLMEQMELREALAVAPKGPDPYGAVGEVMARLSSQSSQLTAQLASCLEAKEGTDLAEAREILRKLQFVRRCQAKAEALEADLDEAV